MPAKCVKKMPSALLNILEFKLALAFVKVKRGFKDIKQYRYRKVGSTSQSLLEAHAGFFRLSIKGKFDVYFHIINTR